jgi:hypothetical protein
MVTVRFWRLPPGNGRYGNLFPAGPRGGRPCRTIPTGDMGTIELPWAIWRAVITVLRASALPYKIDRDRWDVWLAPWSRCYPPITISPH